ncbi:MAG: zinc carboxypeptidase [Bacteroidetes bacterium]|nr:zinc carboxypeptidase [Bacteroidota bacterium]MBS1930413.1 zinc carboxypeptidase [Bacteroidota bacterium]
MRKRNALFTFLLLTSIFTKAQLKSPEEFLGYKIGSQFTPHWKIVNYFNHVAANAPTMVKLQQYGATNEGRPLLLAFISSPENIQQLENIRMNNLRLANLAKGNPDGNREAAIEDNAPAIVWLSYNVHGNEASSSEASMLTLYSLIDPSNVKTKEWLKNTVVVIDPCMNPDGRDRYVNWYNSVVGKNYNPQLSAREHREPWPGGRTNHYNFDLNRDWAWQTQKESQERLKVYNQWLPEVHVDYHEQGINAPYYFAPAAQPFHDVITPWQRDFQVTIGKNNAKYFDQNSWLFFTKEEFDLFYPSYGDTYPTYNGSIGMTYEQAGGPAGGLGALKKEGDTLTLYDRAIHHFTTSLSTIEIASQNAKKLISEFHKYFNEAVRNGVGEYKTYVIKNTNGASQRINALTELFDKNGIRYEISASDSKNIFNGYEYNTAKTGTFTVQAGDVVVSSYQPKSALIKALLEPQSRLVDSATYDISAWSLPYAYGLNAFASKDKISAAGMMSFSKVKNTGTSYGYVMPWAGVATAKVVSSLLQKGMVLRYAEDPFEENGIKFDRGAIIILKTSNQSLENNLWNIIRDVADANNIQLYPVTTGFVDKGYDFGSSKVHSFKAPKVAMLTGEGVNSESAGEVWYFFEQQLNYPLTLINAADANRINWNDFDEVILPGGNYRFLNDKAALEAFKNWIDKGGKLIALENAVSQLASADFGIKIKKEDSEKSDSGEYSDLKNYEDRDRDPISETIPGSILKVDLDNTHPLAFGYPDHYFTLKMDNKIYEFLKNGGWNVGVIKKESQVSGFVGAKLKEKLKDGLLFGVQDMGRGTVTYLADDILFRNFWENGKLMFCNAVFLVGN